MNANWSAPHIDPEAPLQFVINAAAGSNAAENKRQLIEAALQATQRQGNLIFSDPANLAQVARQAADLAIAKHSAVVAVGGDGTINTVAQAAHALGCPMGVIPQGTFNYFARTHGIPDDPAITARQLLEWSPWPVQVAAINEHVFLVNASLGLYPDLLEDREAYKARFGRSRWVAFWAASATLLRAQRRLRMRIEQEGAVRNVKALTLFVGNNRLQLEQLGVPPSITLPDTPGHLTAVMLRPIGTLAMLRLMWHGAMGNLGTAEDIEHFSFNHLVVRPTLTPGRRGVKVAFDGEVTRLRAPLHFQVLSKPLFLIKPAPRTIAVNDKLPQESLGA
ncbi:NAD(+)/NADH kinase [Undibacterium seohonense]|uniref:NAD(+)/NADH kinase n=1 Tax=Undibacterium seohonense TaxID=1344950 RepID=A0ABR6X1Y3_9BURK|nr:diacylglycerol kinase family protein [Undibacterium seohonense]MBC3806786.1 NAD(+)/NADH kinase [Undibacterium seohonense]